MAKIIFSWRHAIVESDLPSTTRHVLLTLSLHMNDVGESCFPSIERIAKETGLSRMSVITHLHKARDAGWIKIGNHGFRGQRWRANEYFCNFPAEEMNEKVVKEIDQADGKVVNLTMQRWSKRLTLSLQVTLQITLQKKRALRTRNLIRHRQSLGHQKPYSTRP